MADIPTSIDFILQRESQDNPGFIYVSPRRGLARYGLREIFNPDLAKSGYFEFESSPNYDGGQNPKIPANQAMATAKNTYATGYAVALQLASIADQDTANRLLLLAAKEGVPQASNVMIQALNHTPKIKLVPNLWQYVDKTPMPHSGELGQDAVAAIQNVDPDTLQKSFVAACTRFYRMTVMHNPDNGQYVKKWIDSISL